MVPIVQAPGCKDAMALHNSRQYRTAMRMSARRMRLGQETATSEHTDTKLPHRAVRAMPMPAERSSKGCRHWHEAGVGRANMIYDLILRGGRLIDPSQRLDMVTDIASPSARWRASDHG